MENQEKKSEYYDVFLTDFQMHVTEPRKPLPWYRAILKSFRNKKPGRFYTKNAKININKDGTFETTIPLSPTIQEEIKKAKNSGKKIRFVIPEEGIPIFAGKDLVEKIKTDRKRRRPLTRFWRNDNIKQD